MTTPGGPSWQGGWDEPGVLSVVLIAAGTTGSGLFVYSGTPAAGNLIYSITAAATGKDLFGNATIGGATSYGPSLPSGFQAISVNAGLITWYTATTTAGPWTAGPIVNGENNSQFTIDFSTAATDVQLALAANLFQVNAPSEFGSYTGFNFVPGVGITALNTSAAETWHAMTPLSNSWAATAGFVAPKYRLVASPPNTVEIIGTLDGTGASSATFFTLPAGYRPATAQGFAIGATGSVPAGSAPNVRCSTGGVLTVANAGAFPLAQSYFIHGFISLDA